MGRPRLDDSEAATSARKRESARRRMARPENRERSRRRSAAYRARRAPVHAAIIDAFLSAPCVDCGVQYPLPAMQPDHVRGKKYKISWFRGGNGTEAMLRAELAKCELRCANCHCIRHATEDGRWR